VIQFRALQQLSFKEVFNPKSRVSSFTHGVKCHFFSSQIYFDFQMQLYDLQYFEVKYRNEHFDKDLPV
jgi:hypothetical protein